MKSTIHSHEIRFSSLKFESTPKMLKNAIATNLPAGRQGLQDMKVHKELIINDLFLVLLCAFVSSWQKRTYQNKLKV